MPQDIMQQQQSTHNISVTWRGKQFILEMNSDNTLKDLGRELQKLTDVKADTMRLIVPQASDRSSKLLSPFSDEHSCLSLQETSFFEGKSIRMMGVPKNEVDEIRQNANANLRIAGFEEEENRMRQRMLDKAHSSLKLPQGPYIFCEFRTLHIPGIELNPPSSEALKRMHMLAADPGIVAIMNKHRWRVGIMTEMAPVGYVGVSPKCILGFNKNHGEEISLRLRTDDLKGFRKYESIKKTLLHELAHMVHSEHDTNFYALDKQLNQEAASLDWTRSKSHTLSGIGHLEHYEEFFVDNRASTSHKLGGKTLDQLANARATSVAAAYQRLANASTDLLGVSKTHQDSDYVDFGPSSHREPEPMDVVEKGKLNIENSGNAQWEDDSEPDPDDYPSSQNKFEPDPDDIEGGEAMESEAYSESSEGIVMSEPDPDDSQMTQFLPRSMTDSKIARTAAREEPDLDDSETALKHTIEVDSDCSVVTESVSRRVQLVKSRKTVDEPDPDDSEAEQKIMGYGNIARSDKDDTEAIETIENKTQLSTADKEPDPDDSHANGVKQAEDTKDNLVTQQRIPRIHTDEPDPDDEELQRIQDPVTIICTRLQKAIELLQSEVNHTEIAGVLETLFRIIRNLIEHPSEMKFKRIRKANPLIQRNVANYKAAMDILFLIGFNEDVVSDEIGKAETYLVLKRNDPGLLWLAKSSLETCIAY
ncbi:Ubiquitin and WLM domain-containing metalloprotease [Actinidia chinensis var. chinensis]|uniref:Ubiquitin and WLM domain-containing metalloprotease n=1 Tax=Actinidia chinensis var. chinensis TaxID=1590841 RepID=A0A2R6QWH6_ACTCC|nr:Ubiquitin and WLM domain-containing metalloprotease [Actinidia chinensis var. chinensis]